MKHIHNLYQKHLFLEDVYTVARRLADFMAANWAEDEYVGDMCGKIGKDLTVIKDALDVSSTVRSEYIPLLHAADDKREEAYESFVDYLQGIAAYPLHMDQSNAAKRILAVFVSHGLRLTSFSYSKKTAVLDAVLSELARPEYTADIKLLKVGDGIENIQKRHDEYEELYRRKVASETSVAYTTTLDSRKNVLYFTKAVLWYIDSRYSGEKNSPVTALQIDDINTIISDITTYARSRATRRKNGEREVIDGNDGDAPEASADAVLQTVDER